ncbi:MAG: hypothetical protein AAFV95_14575 [Bacteroidota bacterium]
MKKKIAEFQDSKAVTLVCDSQLKHLKGGEVNGHARARAKVS